MLITVGIMRDGQKKRRGSDVALNVREAFATKSSMCLILCVFNIKI